MAISDMTGGKKSKWTNLFGKKTAPEVDNGSKYAEVNRENANIIVGKLKNAKTMVIGMPAEEQANWKARIDGVASKYDNKVVRADFSLAPLDKAIGEVADAFIEALKIGNGQVAEKGLLGMVKGGDCRTDFTGDEVRQHEEVVSFRAKIMETIAAGLVGMNFAENELKKISSQSAVAKKLNEEIVELRKELAQVKEEKPVMYESIAKLDVTNLDTLKATLSPEEYELAFKFGTARTRIQQHKRYTSHVEMAKRHRDDILARAKVVDEQLAQNIHKLSEKAKKILEEAYRNVHDETERYKEDIIKAAELERELASEFDIILKDPILGGMLLDDYEWYEELLAREHKREERNQDLKDGQKVNVEQPEQHISL